MVNTRFRTCYCSALTNLANDRVTCHTNTVFQNRYVLSNGLEFNGIESEIFYYGSNAVSRPRRHARAPCDSATARPIGCIDVARRRWYSSGGRRFPGGRRCRCRQRTYAQRRAHYLARREVNMAAARTLSNEFWVE